jgi:hypothetical protein
MNWEKVHLCDTYFVALARLMLSQGMQMMTNRQASSNPKREKAATVKATVAWDPGFHAFFGSL